MCATLTLSKVDLTWADDQYWSTLLKVVGEIAKVYKPKEKKKVTNTEMQNFIRD